MFCLLNFFGKIFMFFIEKCRRVIYNISVVFILRPSGRTTAYRDGLFSGKDL